MAFKVCIAEMLNYICWGSRLEEMAEYTFYYCELVCPFSDYARKVKAHISPKQLVQLNMVYITDNVNPPWTGMKMMVFLRITVMARMVIWMTWLKRLYDVLSFSHYNLIGFFNH